MVTPGVGTATLCQPKVTETRSPVLHVAPGLRGQSADFPAPVTTRSHGSQHGDCATLSLRDRGDEDDPPPRVAGASEAVTSFTRQSSHVASVISPPDAGSSVVSSTANPWQRGEGLVEDT